MTVLDFAAHLGVSGRMVSKWEAGGVSARPRPVNQAALDTSLRLAGDEVRQWFARLLIDSAKAEADGAGARGSVTLADGVRHVVRHPFDGKVMTLVDAGPARPAGRGGWLVGFFIDVAPVTNAEFARFSVLSGRARSADWSQGWCGSGDPAGPGHGDPVTGVAWADALAYAEWASKVLPDAVQWDRAARGLEGMARRTLREWCWVDGRPGRRGPASAPGGGFRCVAPAADLLALLAI